MIPIRLTDNRYINPSCVAEVEFRPKTDYQKAGFYATYTIDHYMMQLFDDEAEEAFRSWTAAIAAIAGNEHAGATEKNE